MKVDEFTLEIPSPTRDRSDTWRVVFRPLERGEYGECHFADRTIVINSRLRRRDTIAATLVHEIIHACSWQLAEGCVRFMEQAIMDGLVKVNLRPKRKTHKR